MVRQHHQLNGHGFEQTLGDSGGQGSLASSKQSMGSPRVGHGLMTEHQEETTYLKLLYCTYIWMDGSFWIHPLVIMQYPFLSLIIVCILKSILSDRSSTIPAFLWLPISCNTFCPPLTFSVYVSLDLKWFSYRQYIYGS